MRKLHSVDQEKCCIATQMAWWLDRGMECRTGDVLGGRVGEKQKQKERESGMNLGSIKV
jgi:hypothetical protein